MKSFMQDSSAALIQSIRIKTVAEMHSVRTWKTIRPITGVAITSATGVVHRASLQDLANPSVAPLDQLELSIGNRHYIYVESSLKGISKTCIGNEAYGGPVSPQVSYLIFSILGDRDCAGISLGD